jgi:carbohydrate kinase (thermoresistant glucokinase family)
MILVVMGVSGSGKTTVGRLLADALALPFIEGDDFHSAGSIARMQSGLPLEEADRQPWLLRLSLTLAVAGEARGGAVLACSALKEPYRLILQGGTNQPVKWILLEGPADLLLQRLRGRQGHFMPETLLPSQLQTLEPPDNALRFSIEKTPEQIVEEILSMLNR